MVIGWIGASSIMSLAAPETEYDFKERVVGALPLITWRQRLRQRLQYTIPQSNAVGTCRDAVDLLLNACPFW